MYFKIIIHNLENSHSGFTVEHTSISSIKEKLEGIFSGHITDEESNTKHKAVLYVIRPDQMPSNDEDLLEALTNPENQHPVNTWKLSSLEKLEVPFLSFVESNGVFSRAGT